MTELVGKPGERCECGVMGIHGIGLHRKYLADAGKEARSTVDLRIKALKMAIRAVWINGDDGDGVERILNTARKFEHYFRTDEIDG